MQKMRFKKTAQVMFSISVLTTPLLHAEPKDGKACSIIESADLRLKCYDSLFKSPSTKGKDTPLANVEHSNLEQKSVSATQTLKTSISPQDKETVPSTHQKQKDVNGEDLFGMEDKIRNISPNQIASTAKGEFKNWKKKLSVNLENGQIWKIIDSRTIYHKIIDPKITIEKGALGAFYMRIEGLNARLRVKRIK